ncbi:MAG: Fe-S protein assembly co-chaperone HscB [Bryobacterales bacterium]|nr:Fe-S protein assembly co-chaperone HscB [Bryobacterales bacterium]
MERLTSCWNCGKNTEQIHFCGSCSSLQPPATNYYDFFGFEHRLNLDPAALEDRFYRLSRRLHPDVYFRRSAREQQFSLDATAILNDGYRTLKNPISRAEYLLKEKGITASENGRQPPPELLEEVFELNEMLEELRQGDDSLRPQLEEAEQRFLKLRDEIDCRLQVEFELYDASGDRSRLLEVRSLLSRRRYIRNLIEEVERELVGA